MRNRSCCPIAAASGFPGAGPGRPDEHRQEPDLARPTTTNDALMPVPVPHRRSGLRPLIVAASRLHRGACRTGETVTWSNRAVKMGAVLANR
jgi:hypothetical protein